MQNSLGVLILALLSAQFYANSQSLSIKEEMMPLDTYGFGKPNPVPIVSQNPKIIPYYKFEEYAQESLKKEWKVVTLENDYIKVFVLPEIGGKVWGAIEKSTGQEFLYKNEVIKFRNIAMRGPWTSGGIEFNFGIIGHHPSTATPVDYLTRTNTDGSVSCIVGNKDLPSNTNWTVEIRLEKDKAYFETNASWYNASNLTQSYYNWMTAAAVATYDLEFFIPGNAYVEHNGDAHSWPIDEEGRNLSMYKNNTFGPSKSYHVVGEYNDFFGGYYHDRNFGFGHWATYEEMPGQKLWLWDLSRSGGIWEDLLTDSDGQYIEFQAGRLFDQYFPGAVNPISQVGFDPQVMDTWSEIWFPYKEIGGMEDASKHGVLNVEIENGQLYFGLNALESLNHEIQVKINGQAIFTEVLKLRPMDVFSKKLTVNPSDKIEVAVGGTELYFVNNPDHQLVKRPFYPDKSLKVSDAEKLLQEGMESFEFREYDKAHQKLSELVQLDPSHRGAHVKLAELEYRKSNYEKALEHCNTVLRMDTYDAGANYFAGISYTALNDTLNALESLGWAARDIKYRSAAYALMGELHISQKNYAKAKIYAHKALTNNVNNVNAREVLLLLARVENSTEQFVNQAKAILDSDPLNHLVAFESIMMPGFVQENEKTIPKNITNEFEDETILQVALRYHQLGFDTEAMAVLKIGKRTTKNNLWLSYLQRGLNEPESQQLLNRVLSAPINMVFPYRRETLPVLVWAATQRDHWKIKYYLAQNYLAVGLTDKGQALLEELGDLPDSDVFYRFRAAMLKDSAINDRQADYKKALALNPSDWKIWEENILFQLQNGNFEEALHLSKKGYKTFFGNYNIALAHAKALLNSGNYLDVISVLKTIQVLPYEHASESRNIYERAHIGVAISELKKNKYTKALKTLELCKEWPENIGVGKPYDPDERPQDYLMALIYEKMGNSEKSRSAYEAIVSNTEKNKNANSLNHLFGLLAAKKLDNSSLEPMLASLERRMHESDENGKAALAFFRNDSVSLNLIKEHKTFSDDIWEMASWVANN